MDSLLRGFAGAGTFVRQAAGPSLDPIAGEKRAREDNVWSAVLRGRHGEVRLEWKSADLDAARSKLLDRSSRAVRSSTLQAPGPIASQGIDTEAAIGTADQEKELTVRNLEDSLPASVQMSPTDRHVPLVAAYQGEALSQFLAGVTELELCRIQTNERLEATNIPFDTSALASLQVLRCQSDDILAPGTLEVLVKPTLQSLDVTAQKILQPRIENVLTSTPLELLTVLNLRKNQLTQLPASVMEGLPNLTDLDASENRLAEVPGNLLQLCRQLQVLNLESNKLVVPALDFRDAVLRSLLLGQNSIEYLPTLAPLTSLVQLSVHNLRISRAGPRPDPAVHFETVPVSAEVVAKAGAGWSRAVPWSGDGERQVRGALSLLFRSSAAFHSLVAAFLALLAADDKYAALLHSAEPGGAGTGGVQHTLAMCQAGEPVCLDACVAVGRLAGREECAETLVGLQAVSRLLDKATDRASEPVARRFALEALRRVAGAGDRLAVEVLQGQRAGRQRSGSSTEGDGGEARGQAEAEEGRRECRLVGALMEVMEWARGEGGARGARGVEVTALLLLGDCGHAAQGREVLRRHPRLLEVLRATAAGGAGEGEGVERIEWRGREWDARLAARRVLVVLGEQEGVGGPVWGRYEGGAEGGAGRGLRILTVDGGGVKGLAAIRVLAEIEREAGRQLGEVFDLVVGTSAGGIIAAGICSGMGMEETERVYNTVVRKAFSVEMKGAEAGAEAGEAAGEGEEAGAKAGEGSWWQKLVQSGSSMRRFIATGAKYEAAPLVAALGEGLGAFGGEAMVVSPLTSARCHCAVVAALCSVRPLTPFVFRTFQLPPGVRPAFPGDCRFEWLAALRASSAAPYFFEEFSLGALRFQDGALVANNPSIVALLEAQRLWPGRGVECVVSVGTGAAATVSREVKRSGAYGLIDTFGEMMVESAVSTERAAEALAAVAPLVPGTRFFRLQAEGERFGVEIDDTSAEARAGLCAGVADYVAASRPLFRDLGALLRGEPTPTPRPAPPPPRARGGGAARVSGELGGVLGGGGAGGRGALSVLVVDGEWAEEGGRGWAVAEALAEAGVAYGVWRARRGGAGRGGEAGLREAVGRSRATVVHVAGATLGGSELVVGWEQESVTVGVEGARALLQASRRREAAGGGGGEAEEEDEWSLVRALAAQREGWVSEREGWQFGGVHASLARSNGSNGAPHLALSFEKIRAADTLSWPTLQRAGTGEEALSGEGQVEEEEVREEGHGAWAGRVVVVEGVLSEAAARGVVAHGGAEAVVQYGAGLDEKARGQAARTLYASLQKGRSAAMAAADANAALGTSALHCLHAP